MPFLRILAGPTPDALVPIEVNSGQPVALVSDAFEGQVAMYIKGFSDAKDSEYFKKRTGVTWSIQVQGRFLKEYTADDLLFGNVFEEPLKSLPWGFSAALKFMSFIDPTLEQDLASRSKPWALSPLIATMPYFHHSRVENSAGAEPVFPPKEPIDDDTSQLCVQAKQADGSANGRRLNGSPSKRRSYFRNALRRQEVVFGPQDLITTDFCYDFLKFSPDSLTLRLPGGISIDMMRYWDGQPVRFVCCERLKKGERTAERPWGRVLWCVAIESADGDSEEQSVEEKDEDGKGGAKASDVD